MKLCFRCFSVIPSMASRCPNCLDQHQGTWGRIILLILAVAAAVWLLQRCADGRWPFDKPKSCARQTDCVKPNSNGRGAWQPILPGW